MKKVNFNASNSLAHTKWNCKFHIVFALKYRRKVFFEEKRLEIFDRVNSSINHQLHTHNRIPATTSPTMMGTYNKNSVVDHIIWKKQYLHPSYLLRGISNGFI